MSLNVATKKENNPTLFIVEDDKSLSFLMKSYFEEEGFEVTCIEQGSSAVTAIVENQPDVVMLDLDLPGIDGLEVCRKARKEFNNSIIMLTGNDSEFVEIASLNTGADKFLRKPVKLSVLLAHINAELRRSEYPRANAFVSPTNQTSSVKESVVLEKESLSVLVHGERVDLSSCETQILKILMENAGTCVSRDRLYQEIRGFGYDGLNRTIDLKISSLRKKLGDETAPFRLIKTVRSKGYIYIGSIAPS